MRFFVDCFAKKVYKIKRPYKTGENMTAPQFDLGIVDSFTTPIPERCKCHGLRVCSNTPPTQTYIGKRCGELHAKSLRQSLSGEDIVEWRALQSHCDCNSDQLSFAHNGEDCEQCFRKIAC